jgi:hypothetical protein
MDYQLLTLIIEIITLIVISAIAGVIFTPIKSNENVNNNNQDTKPAFLNGFHVGEQNMISLINLAIFKLSEEGQLFGGNDIIENIHKILNGDFRNQQTVNEWINKYKEHQK